MTSDPRRLRSVPVLRLAILVAVCGLKAAVSAAQTPTVALVASLDGTPSVRLTHTADARPLTLFERLPAGARIETGPGTTVLIVHRSGQRARLAAVSVALVGESMLEAQSGHVDRLAGVPPLPVFDPPAKGVPLGRVAAVRIRGHEFHGLYPRAGARSLADSTTLTFEADQPLASYDVQIEDAGGRVVFSRQLEHTQVRVPASVLEPGRDYVWRVSARTPSGIAIRGEAGFATLSAEHAAWREAARRGSDARGPDAVWLAEIDLALGLVLEARAAFLASAAGHNSVIAARVAAIDAALRAPAAQGARQSDRR
jgi:hypothetical protein